MLFRNLLCWQTSCRSKCMSSVFCYSCGKPGHHMFCSYAQLTLSKYWDVPLLIHEAAAP